jgi:hypothetical protein
MGHKVADVPFRGDAQIRDRLRRSKAMTGYATLEHETRERLERMERELRRWRWGGAIVLTLGLVAVAAAMAEPPAKELRVQTLRIVESDGTDRIVLTAEKKIPDMTFLDPDGKSRLTLDIAEDHKPVLQFAEGGKEKGRMTMGIDEGGPMLQFYDRQGKKRLVFGVPKAGGPALRILDETERTQTRFP